MHLVRVVSVDYHGLLFWVSGLVCNKRRPVYISGKKGPKEINLIKYEGGGIWKGIEGSGEKEEYKDLTRIVKRNKLGIQDILLLFIQYYNITTIHGI